VGGTLSKLRAFRASPGVCVREAAATKTLDSLRL
jgi:hypothetical protein